MPSARSSDETNSLIHLYRGELGRTTAYRMRLDTTTYWAIFTATGLVFFAMRSAPSSHVIYLLTMLLTLFFLNLEAMRFSIYHLSHLRVRLMELGYFQEVLGGEAYPNWQAELAESLRHPQSPLSHLDAIGWRLRLTYLWIYGALLLAWLADLWLLSQQQSFLQAAAVGRIPGGVIFLLVSSFYLALIVIAARSAKRIPPEVD